MNVHFLQSRLSPKSIAESATTAKVNFTLYGTFRSQKKARGKCRLVWAIFAIFSADASAQAWNLPPEHFLAAPIAEAAKVYDSRVAARQATEKKQWVTAIANWDQLLSIWPDDFEALNAKADIYSVELSRPSDALNVRELAAKAAPWNFENQYQICSLNVQLKRYEEAIESCELVLELLHGHIGAMMRLTDMQFISGKHAQATAQYRQLVERIDTQEQLDQSLRILKGLPVEAEESAATRNALVAELEILWKSDELVRRRAARLAFADILKNQLAPIMKKWESEAPFDDSIEVLRKVYGKLEALRHTGPGDTDYFEAALGFVRVYSFLSEMKWPEAFHEAKRIELMAATSLGRGHPITMKVAEASGVASLMAGATTSEKAEVIESFLNISKKSMGRYSREGGHRALINASDALRVAGDQIGATNALVQSQVIIEGVAGAISEEASASLERLGDSIQGSAGIRLAEPILYRNIFLLEKFLGTGHPKVVRAQINFGSLLVDLEKYEEAVQLLEEVRDVRSKSSKIDVKLDIEVAKALTSAYERLGQSNAAEISSGSGTSNVKFTAGESSVSLEDRLAEYSGHLDIEDGVRLSESGDIDAGIRKINSGKDKFALLFGEENFNIAEIEWKLSDLEIKIGRFNSALARAAASLELNRHGNVLSSRTRSKLWLSRAQALGGLKRFEDAYDPSVRFLILSSLLDGRSTRMAIALNNLSEISKYQGKNSVAIFLQKSAVNMVQQKRVDLLNLSEHLQKDFLKKYSGMYQLLSSMLIERGRVVEAEQVLQMLKELELRELTPRSKVGAAKHTTSVDLGGAEQRAQRRMDELLDESAGLQADLTRAQQRLKLLVGDEVENQRRASEMEGKLQAWEMTIRDFLAKLPQYLPEPGAPGAVQEAEKSKGRLQAVVQRDAATVGLQFVVTEDRLGIILASREGTVGYFSQISRVELSQRVSQLRTAILNKADTLEAGQALWKALLGPVEADLERLGARTLLLASTDVLRYLPFAALQDGGGRYLIERYALANWLSAAPDPKPRSQAVAWRVAALGVTQARPGFSALPGVRLEINGIVRSSANPEGPLPGTAYLDDEFDLQHLDDAIGGGGNVVHVASHFDFRPGDERRSVLLVGRGDPVSMASLARRDFAKVEQLTLSACETATGGGYNETGAEVEGLAALLLVKQARSVMGTLWKVADGSTAQLMVTYYRQLQGGHAGGKAEALRSAQLQLLRGQEAAGGDTTARGARPLDSAATTPPTPSARSPWSHPYYWAPFVISGDWM